MYESVKKKKTNVFARFNTFLKSQHEICTSTCTSWEVATPDLRGAFYYKMYRGCKVKYLNSCGSSEKSFY